MSKATSSAGTCVTLPSNDIKRVQKKEYKPNNQLGHAYIRQHLHPVRSFKFGDVQISNRLVLGKEDEKVVAHRDDGT